MKDTVLNKPLWYAHHYPAPWCCSFVVAKFEKEPQAGEGSGDFKGALKELDAARRRASENQELAQATIRDLKEKNM